MPSVDEAPHLTRADRRARTVADLIATARAAFLADGYSGTSLDAIAESAGYSKGAVYSNFKDKPTLCRAVLEDIHREKMDELAGLSDAADGEGLASLADSLAEWLRRSLGDVGWTMLEFEFVTLSRRNPEIREMVVELRREARSAIAGMLERLVGDPAEYAPDLDGVPGLDEVADLLLSTGIGLSIQRAVDPEVSVEPAITVIRSTVAMLDALG